MIYTFNEFEQNYRIRLLEFEHDEDCKQQGEE